jgi:hypothetical protein
MALSTAGLTNNGLTTNFKIQYEDTLPNQATVKANANALIAIVENEFTVTTGWFNTPSGKFGTGNRQVVNLNIGAGGGGNNGGYGSAVNIDSIGAGPNPLESVKMVFMNEWVEILMSLTGGKWNAGDSNGEGLSQYAGIVRFQTGHYSYYGSWVDQWLNKQPRQDWVNNTEGTDGNAISFGCSLAFIFYLNTELGFSINQIIAAGASNLTAICKSLTGDNGDPYPFFANLLEHVYPSSGPANIPGPVSDNPFPLGQLAFWVDKSTFGKDEVQDVINVSAGKFPNAFWLIVEGFSKDSFNSLGATIPAPTGSFATTPGVTISQGSPQFENAANSKAPQRVRIPFDITFTNALLASFPVAGGAPTTRELDAFIQIGGKKVPGSDAATIFELVAGADPYFTNIDPSQNNVFYLSQDLRVFTATPGQSNTPVAGGPNFGGDNVGGAYQYIKDLLNFLNSNFSNPGGSDPFSTILPGQGGSLTGDSSVTPFTLDLSNFFNPKIFNNYNFAVARARLRGTAGPTGAAQNVRVFFRLWSTETADTDYQTLTTYRSNLDAAGLPGSPQVGSGHNTFPFFGSNNSGSADYGPGGINIRDVTINSGDSVWAYYGCFLNLYDSGNNVDGKPIQQWLVGTHHCIVAQIAYDGAPIINANGITASPENSDKLAQRNLQVTRSDNPGPASTHRIPQTFDIRPSAALVEQNGILVNRPDELMIDWGAIPAGSIASIYWPQASAAQVLALATRLYGSHTLTASDANTIQCTVTGGITYVPIPPGAGENFAGLFTVDLPSGIVAGQEFNIIVRRIATRSQPTVILRTLPATIERPKRGVKAEAAAVVAAAQTRTPTEWRYVVGTFQVKIPVATGDTLLVDEENTLAIMKWRLQQMEPSNRWYPVLQRYVSYLAGRVDGLGGDSNAIAPSPNGVSPGQLAKATVHEYTGKVCEVIFDCFGDFEGFVLCDCDVAYVFKSRKRGIAKLALRACKEGLRLSVFADAGPERRIRRIIVRC